MSEFVLHAEIRELTGKHAKHTRLAGMVPGVFYAREEKPLKHTGPEARTRSARVHVRDTRHRPSPEGRVLTQVHTARRAVRPCVGQAGALRPPGVEGRREAHGSKCRSS